MTDVALGTAVLAGIPLRITKIELVGGEVLFHATTKPDTVGRSVYVAPGEMVRIHGVDGKSVATLRLPPGTQELTTDPAMTLTLVLPMQLEITGAAAWPGAA